MPEYRLTTPDGQSFLAEVKTIEAALGKNGLQRNLQKAISQIKEASIRTGEKGGYIRIDASSSPSTTLTRDQIEGIVKGQLLTIDQKTGTKGSDFVEFVEVLYKDTAGQPQKLLARVQQNGSIVTSP